MWFDASLLNQGLFYRLGLTQKLFAMIALLTPILFYIYFYSSGPLKILLMLTSTEIQFEIK